jgi:hypothetical protein
MAEAAIGKSVLFLCLLGCGRLNNPVSSDPVWVFEKVDYWYID